MSLQNNTNLVNLLEDDDDESIPGPVFQRKRPAVTVPTAASAPAKKPAPPKKPKQTKAFTLIWVCTHGKGQSRKWRQKDLKVIGVYSTKAAAENAKQELMSKYECCGHGDILVGGMWDDEIDLVIRDTPLFLDE